MIGDHASIRADMRGDPRLDRVDRARARGQRTQPGERRPGQHGGARGGIGVEETQVPDRDGDHRGDSGLRDDRGAGEGAGLDGRTAAQPQRETGGADREEGAADVQAVERAQRG